MERQTDFIHQKLRQKYYFGSSLKNRFYGKNTSCTLELSVFSAEVSEIQQL